MPFICSSLVRFIRFIVHPLQREHTLVSLLMVLFLSNACITGRPSHHWWYYTMVALFDSYLLALLVDQSAHFSPRRLSVFLRSMLKSIIYFSAFALWTIEIFLFERFHLCISPTVVHLLLETSPAESSEFVEGMFSNNIFWNVLFSTSALLLLSFLLEFWKQAKAQHFVKRIICNIKRIIWRKNVITLNTLVEDYSLQRKKLRCNSNQHVGACLVGIILCALFVPWCNHQYKMFQFLSNRHSECAENIAESEFFSPYYRCFQAIHLVKIAAHETDALIARMQHLPKTEIATDSCPNIVLIVGESYNKHHSALYGYPLPTTPRLSERAKRGELIVFDDVISPWNITSNAFRAFLSTHSSDEGGRWTDGILFPALFKQSGYRVAFLSNQFFHTASQGSIDFNGSFFLNDARIEAQCFDFRNSFRSKNDGTILTLLKGFESGQRNLYLFHLWGQHMEYKYRYPSDKTAFTAQDIPRSDLNNTQRDIVAHYDNATRWNDEVVDRILLHFAQQDALVIYFSDHGEEVYDAGVNAYGRIHDEQPSATVIRNEYEVPFMIWGSHKFRQRHPDLFAQIQSAKHRPFSHDDLPHLLLGISGISTPYYQPQRDPLSPKFQPQRRLLRDKIDYDAALQRQKSTEF